MGKKPEALPEKVANALSFFKEIGADFAVRGRTPAPVPNSGPLPPGPRPKPRTVGRDAARLAAIAEEIWGCQKCPLSKSRAHAVPGEGAVDAGLMFVGEGPGADENAQGRPFVGRAGQLLTKIIAAMGFQRSEVFITNIVKCQPPGNRTPLEDEVEACTPYLLRQIEAAQPTVIVALGGVAANYFVPGNLKISALRGTFYDYGPVKIMPTFHPSYLIRNEGNTTIKGAVWGDMKKVMALLGKK